MAASGVLRGRKPDSVQFWLAIAAVSLLLHALLIVGIKRWGTMVVEPDAGPIAVEWVEPAGSDAVDVPIGQASVPKPEVKPDLKSEIQPEFQIKPEPIVKPEVKAESKKVQPAIVPNQVKPQVARQPRKEISPPPRGKKSGLNDPQKGLPENSKPSLGGGQDLSREPGTVGQRTVGITLLSTQQNDTAGADDRKATLRLKPFPSTSQLSANFVSDVGQTITVSIDFLVRCTKSQGLTCVPSDIKLDYQSSKLPRDLSSEYDLELGKVINNWIQTLQAESLVYQPDPLGKTDVLQKPPTYWTIKIQLQGKN